MRRSLKSPVRVSSSSQCINVSDDQLEGTLPFELSARLPDSPTQEINVSNTGGSETSVPSSENSEQSRDKLFSDIFKNIPKVRPHSAALSSGERYKNYILGNIEDRMTVWPGDSKQYNRRRYPNSFDIGDLLVNSSPKTYFHLFTNKRICSTISRLVEDMTNDENKQNGIFGETYELAERAVKKLFLSGVQSKNNLVEEYVVDNYIKNNWFLSKSIKLCPSVSSYAVALSNGIPPFIRYIMIKVKEHYKWQENVYNYCESLDLLRRLYRVFFRTLIYRLLLPQDQIVETIEDGKVVHLTTGVQIDIPSD